MSTEPLEAGQARILKRAQTILEAARERASQAEGWELASRIDEMRIVVGYAEPGYGCTDSIIAFGNWNPLDRGRYGREGHVSGFDIAREDPKALEALPARVSTLLERAGVEIEWSDEWSECGRCGRAVRTQPDSYSWTRSYTECDGDIECEDCTLEDPSSYLEGLEDNPQTAVTLSVDPAEHGYIRIPETFERGWHPGQADNPETIAEALREMDITRFIFSLDSVGQFDARFSVHVHGDDIDDLVDTPEGRTAAGEALLEALRVHGTADAVSPGELMARALRELPAAPSGPGVTVYKVSPEGSTVRKVSPEDFAAGRALDD